MVWRRTITQDCMLVVGAPRGLPSSLVTTLMRRSLIPAKGNARGRVVTASVPRKKRIVMSIPHNAAVSLLLAPVGATFLWNVLELHVLEESCRPLRLNARSTVAIALVPKRKLIIIAISQPRYTVLLVVFGAACIEMGTTRSFRQLRPNARRTVVTATVAITVLRPLALLRGPSTSMQGRNK